MFNMNEKITNGANTLKLKVYKVATVIGNIFDRIIWNANYRQLRALERENQRIVSTVIGLECRKVRNAQKMSVLKNRLE